MTTDAASEKKAGRKEIGCYGGSLYDSNSFSLSRFLEGILSRVGFSDEAAEELRGLYQKGVVVYAQKNASQIDALILREVLKRKGIPPPIYCHAVNMAAWQPLFTALKCAFTRLFNIVLKKDSLNPYKTEYLREITKRGESSLIYLRDSDFLGSPYPKDPLIQLIHAQKEMETPIFVVPVGFFYGKRREKKNKTIMEILLGHVENPDPLRRVITFLRYSKKATVVPAKPVNLAEYLEAENPPRSYENISYNLRRELIDRINEERRVVFGPVLKSREEIIVTVLRDAYLVKAMEELATVTKKDFKAVFKEAKKYLKEIAADYQDIYIDIWYKILTWLWNNVYDGVVVDREGLAMIRDISKRMPFVIVPCHRSHIDYLLLSYVFEVNSIPLPFVAAGTNLMFWPLGPIFRKSGAFFVRRGFKGNVLYREVFAKYIKVLLKEGLPIEFFIEGGRSRTGKMVMPRYGMLSMIIQAYKEGISSDLAVIPVFIGYDRVMEEKAYLEELGGAQKAREKATDVIKSGGLLRRRYGRVYVNIGKPIFLKNYMTSLEKTYEDMTVEERQSFYRKIGYEVVGEINKVSVVTPSALVAAAMLCHYRRGISHDELVGIINELYEYLACRNVKFASTFANRERAVADALSLFETAGLISKMGIEEEDRDEEVEEIVYSLDEDKRLNLEYYKNNILHFFVPLSFVATSILSSSEDTIPLYRILEDYKFFRRLFKNEFIFDDKVDDVEEVNQVLNYSHDRGMIEGKERDNEAWIEVKGKGRVGLRPYAGLIHNYIESYWVVIRGCSYLKKGARTEREFTKKIQQLGTRMYKKGEIMRAEALSSSNYKNAVKFLCDLDVLFLRRDKDKKDRKETVVYSLTDDRSEVESLRQRLFKFL
ncbi:MAG: 1-acyl-sn-glycerol-3-phosphate acyltransferase [Syntrophobacterales bacterium]|nr:1-acyl-sn-glycerol-3-phosphate acyltransferase [Syntrophobacterales bacterium]